MLKFAYPDTVLGSHFLIHVHSSLHAFPLHTYDLIPELNFIWKFRSVSNFTKQNAEKETKEMHC